MKRIDLVYNSLKDLDKGEGISTIELSEYLNLERSNVSKDLNNLVKNGMVFKNNSRPVRYFSIIQTLMILLTNPLWTIYAIYLLPFQRL